MVASSLPRIPLNRRPSGAVPNCSRCSRSNSASSGQAGTGRLSPLARCLSWRRSRWSPSSVHPRPASGEASSNSSSPQPSDSAEQLLHRASDLVTGAGDPPESLYWYTEPFLRMNIGLTQHAIGQHRDAADSLASGMVGLPADQQSAEWLGEYKHRPFTAHVPRWRTCEPVGLAEEGERSVSAESSVFIGSALAVISAITGIIAWWLPSSAMRLDHNGFTAWPLATSFLTLFVWAASNWNQTTQDLKGKLVDQELKAKSREQELEVRLTEYALVPADKELFDAFKTSLSKDSWIMAWLRNEAIPRQ